MKSMRGRTLRQKANLSGKTAVVTGSSRGLGFLLARELAREGCRVCICARSVEELERARRDLESLGAEVMSVTCDVTSRSQVDDLVRQVKGHWGEIDILVNNAGIIQVGPVEQMTLEDFEQAMDVMFWGAVYPTLALLPSMLARGEGRIVNITSIGGKVSPPHLLPYNSAKFAAVGFSEGLAAEVRSKGVTVTTVVPGLMRTGSHLNAYFKGSQEREFAWFALGASLPLISMDAERAVRQIIAAAMRGQAEVILTMPAKFAVRAHGAFPGTTVRVLSIVNKLLLPGPAGEEAGKARGGEVRARMNSTVLDRLTGLGLSAANRFHEHPPEAGGPTDR